ncbi:TorF family putative porin [Variovorax sp. DXTD-1]|uniref:TorF family putative porin n=1 Tax=Variovorax sp. DXTD-1 TaxID=2495592 RepID=UPI0021AEA45F|nr:TorF family putative porin [Variovorax sp. DXTD-1]
MKSKQQLLIGSFALLAAMGAAAQVQTADALAAPMPKSEASPLSANVTLTSQYVSRGFRQTWGQPAVQGGLDYAHPSGFSVGTWLSTVNKKYIEGGTLEWDLYGGYTGAVGDMGYSAILYYYRYPGALISASHTKYDYGELSVGLTYKFLYAKYNYTLTKDFFGITAARGTGYLDLGANYDLGSGYTLNLHYGRGRVASTGANDNSSWNWQDYKVGVSKALADGWTLAGAYTRAKGATNIYDCYTTGVLNSAGVTDVSNPAKRTFMVSLSKVF